GAISGSRPEARGVGSERFVNPDKFAVQQAKFEFGVCQQNAARSGIGGGTAVNLKRNAADLFGPVFADDFDRAFEGNVFVVSRGRFGGRREDYFRQLVGFLKAGRQ